MNDEMLRGIDEYKRKENDYTMRWESDEIRTLRRTIKRQKDAVDCGLRKIEKMRGVIDDKNEQIERLTTDNEDLKVEVEDTTDQYCSDILELRREIKALSALLKMKL